jgi:hypothetical protein
VSAAPRNSASAVRLPSTRMNATPKARSAATATRKAAPTAASYGSQPREFHAPATLSTAETRACRADERQTMPTTARLPTSSPRCSGYRPRGGAEVGSSRSWSDLRHDPPQHLPISRAICRMDAFNALKTGTSLVGELSRREQRQRPISVGSECTGSSLVSGMVTEPFVAG